MPQPVIDAVLAVNYILNGSKKECSPNNSLGTQLKNKCAYIYTDIITKDYVLSNLIKANLAKGDKTEDLFFKIKQFLILNWLKKHFSRDDFFTFFLNYSYYGDNIIGINSAISKFFGKDGNLNKISPEQAAFLAQKIFQNNSYIYFPNSYSSMVQVDKILDAMNELKFITDEELKTAKAAKLKVEDTSPNNQYQLYANSMISVALPKTVETNDITIYSTLNKTIQNSVASTLVGAANTYNIPSAAVYGVENGKIVTGISFDNTAGIIHYNNSYPVVKTKYLLRPFFYLGLLSNNIKVPVSLINPDIQNIVVEQELSPSNLNTKYFPVFAENLNNTPALGAANSQQTALNKIAMQLVAIETQLFAKLDDKAIEKLTTKFMLPKDSIKKADNTYYLTAPFEAIVNSYAVLNQNGNFYVPIFMTKINNESLKSSTLITTDFDKDAINKVFKQNIRIDEVSGYKFKVIYDYNMAIIMYDRYTVGVWLGNNNATLDQNLAINRYPVLQKVSRTIVQLLVSAINASNANKQAIKNNTGNEPQK